MASDNTTSSLLPISPDGVKPYKGRFYLWHYVPSIAAAVIFALIFVTIMGAHVWRLWKTRLWYCIPIAVGCFMEFVGYCARAKASSATDKLMPFVVQNSFILLPPALFAASVYMAFGRLVVAINGEAYSLIRVRWLTKTFVIGDVVSLVVQGGAAGLMATGDYQVLGQWIVVAGLIFQIIMFGFFMVISVVFQYRYERLSVGAAAYTWMEWRPIMNMLYAVSLLIMVRSIFRTIEFILGYDGYPLQHEWTLYVFDAVLMVAAVAMFYFRYPYQYNPSKGRGERIESTENLATPVVYLSNIPGPRGA